MIFPAWRFFAATGDPETGDRETVELPSFIAIPYWVGGRWLGAAALVLLGGVSIWTSLREIDRKVFGRRRPASGP